MKKILLVTTYMIFTFQAQCQISVGILGKATKEGVSAIKEIKAKKTAKKNLIARLDSCLIATENLQPIEILDSNIDSLNDYYSRLVDLDYKTAEKYTARLEDISTRAEKGRNERIIKQFAYLLQEINLAETSDKDKIKKADDLMFLEKNNKSLVVVPDTIYAIIGISCYNLSMPWEAINHLEKYYETTPERYKNIDIVLGNSYLDISNLEQAQALGKRLLSAYSEDEDVNFLCYRINKALKNNDKTLDIINLLVTKYPENYNYRRERAYLNYSNKEYLKAKTDYLYLVKHDNATAIDYECLGFCELDAKDVDNAILYFLSAKELGNKQVEHKIAKLRDGNAFVGVNQTPFYVENNKAAKITAYLHAGMEIYVQDREDKITGLVRVLINSNIGAYNGAGGWIPKDAIFFDESLIVEKSINSTRYTLPQNSSLLSLPKDLEYQGETYYTGPRGGCYYINSKGRKQYVDKSYCE